MVLWTRFADGFFDVFLFSFFNIGSSKYWLDSCLIINESSVFRFGETVLLRLTKNQSINQSIQWNLFEYTYSDPN